MPATPHAILRMYNRLAPIARLQWHLARDGRDRARVAVSVTHLVSADVALALIHRLRRLASRPVPIYINGLVHYADIAANEIVPLIEIYEGSMYRAVPGFTAEPGQLVVDIGANIGAFTLWQAQRGATVYAFEPNPASYTRLARAVARNGLSRQVHLVNQAVGSSEGHGSLAIPNDNSTAATLHTNVAGPIAVTTLAALCQRFRLSHIDILKIDAEGSEAAILEGGRAPLGHVRHIVLEYHSGALEEHCRRLLTEYGFTILTRSIIDEQAGIGVLYAGKPVHRASTSGA